MKSGLKQNQQKFKITFLYIHKEPWPKNIACFTSCNEVKKNDCHEKMQL